ncbi:MAG: hypothetical protein H6567_02605 [Lewinellaceae bacterium]|nr:hypothetical protein [Lewinellaceae bacterium]
MKYILISILFLSLSSLTCNSDNGITGHWQCNSNGTYKTLHNGVWTEIPVADFYSTIQIHPLEFEFNPDETFRSIIHKADGSVQVKEGNFVTNFEGDPNKIFVSMPNDTSDDLYITTISRSGNQWHAEFYQPADEFILNLYLQKLF